MQIGQPFNPRGMFRFLMIPDAIARCKDIKAFDKLLYGKIAEYMGQHEECWPAQKTLADGLGVNVRLVNEGIKRLAEYRLLGMQAPEGKARLEHKTARYQLLWHELLEDELHTKRRSFTCVNSGSDGVVNPTVRELHGKDSSPLPPNGGIPPSWEGESKVAQARKVHEHHCRVMSDNPDKPREWKFEVYEAAYYRMLKKFTPEELMLASTNLAASRWHRGDNPDGKQYCDPFWLFGEKQAPMKVAKWIQEAGGAGVAPTSDEQYIHAHYANCRAADGGELTESERDWLRRSDESRATKAGKGLAEYLRDEEARRARLRGLDE